MDKLLKIFKVNKKISYFLLIITIIAIISGSLLLILLKDNTKITVMSSIDTFFNNVINNTLDYHMSLKSCIITNILYVLIIWLFGISIIGIPVILIIYFIKTFTLGFTIAAIISKYGARGIIYSFIYVFPHNILNLFILNILAIYGMIYSFNLMNSFFKKQVIDFKPIMNNYKYVLIVSILITLLASLYGTYLMPYMLKIVLNLIK